MLKGKKILLLSCFFLLTFLFSAAQMRQIYLDPGGDYRIIQKISFYSASQGYIASSDNGPPFVGFTTDSGRTFTKRFITLGNVNYNGYSVNLTFGFGINGVKAFSQDTIIVYGDYGFVPAILYSTNGGQSYLLVYQSQLDLDLFNSAIMDMVFPENNNIGYAIDADRILKTTNKGFSWSVVRTDPNSYFNHIEAVDNNNLVTFSNHYNANKLIKTTNGGSSWQTVPLPVTLTFSGIFYATFLTANKGWLNIKDNNDSLRVFYTSNGGASWVQKNHAEASPFGCQKMKFVNDSTGFAFGLFTTYKTTDSGKVWQPLPRDNNFSYLNYSFYDMQVLNENQLWCGGPQDFLELSTNGGGTPFPKAFFKIDTSNSSTNNIVKLWNYSKPGYQFKWYVNNNLISTAYNTTYTHNVFSPVDSVVLIVTSGALSDTVKKYQYFSVPNLPTITSFSPVTGSTGTYVTITGTNFTGVTGVTIGGVQPASYTIVSNTQITLTVGNGATGIVSVNNPFGGYSLPGFTYFAPPSSGPPIISSFSPASGPTGTIVTINGSNFGSSISNNVVYFGAVKAAINTANTNQISCVVPSGASFEPISVFNKATNLTGESLKPFDITFADSLALGTSSFVNAYTFPFYESASPSYVMGKDLDGDGKPEVVTKFKNYKDSIGVYRNISISGTIAFAPRINLGSTGNYGGELFDVNDVDGDDRPDIVSTTNLGDVIVFRNTSTPGTISFATQVSVPCFSSGNQDVVISDLNNDGKNDIAVAAFSSHTVSVIKNTSVPGYLSFASPINYSITNLPLRIEAADLNGDGKKDLVCYNYNSNLGNTDFTFFRNTTTSGSISFASGVVIVVPGTAVQSRSLKIADYDGDGKVDVIIVNDNNYCIYRNISSGSTIDFSPVITTSLPGFPQGASVANLSGDAKPDILTGNWGSGYFTLIRNNSTSGTIANDAPVNVGSAGVYFTNTGDFDLDGKTDLMVSKSNNVTGAAITIYKNFMNEPVPFSSGYVCAGTTQQRPSDVTGSTYQWQQNTGNGFENISNNATLSGAQTSVLTINNVPLSWNGYLYRCLVNGNLYSSIFRLQVATSLPPAVTINTSSTTICSGEITTFTATTTNTSPITSCSWQVNGFNVQGLNSTVFTTNSLSNGDQVKAILFNACANPNSAFSNVITMTVNGQPPSVTITTLNSTICSGTSTTFTATPVNGGASASYQWQVNGINVGINSNTFITSTLNNNDQVKVLLTATPTSCGTYTPVTSNTITMTVTTPVATTVSIAASNTTVCSGSQVGFSATPTNGGTSPSFQWQLNGLNVGNPGNYYQSAFTVTSQVQVIMTSNSNCITTTTATSNVITITVNNNLTPTITISGNNIITTGQSTTISSAVTNGGPGAGPAYQWQDSTNTHNWLNISGSTSASINYSPTLTGNKLRCVMTSSETCVTVRTVTSNALAFTVYPVTAIIPVAASDYGIRCFPNPAYDNLFIDSLNLADKWQKLDLFSNDGKKLITTLNITGRRSVTLNVSRLPAGQFIAVLRRKSGTPVYLKFIKL